MCFIWTENNSMNILSNICTKGATPETPEKAEKARISYTGCSFNWINQSKFKKEEGINQTFTHQEMTPPSADIDFLAHYQRNRTL